MKGRVMPAPIRIGIVGSRRRDSHEDYSAVVNVFADLVEELGIPFEEAGKYIIIVSGGCPKGGDRFAEIIADTIGAKKEIYYPDKSQLPANPQRWDFARINYARNTLVANGCDILIACVSEDRKGGTEDTIKKFTKSCGLPFESVMQARGFLYLA